MATTARLPETLKAEADAYAQGIGISLNALLAVALRDYLDARKAAAPPPASAVTPAGPEQPIRAPKNPRDRCPCGSAQQWRHCHGRS